MASKSPGCSRRTEIRSVNEKPDGAVWACSSTFLRLIGKDFFHLAAGTFGHGHPMRHFFEILVALPFAQPKMRAELVAFRIAGREEISRETQENYRSKTPFSALARKVHDVFWEEGQHALSVFGEPIFYRNPIHSFLLPLPTKLSHKRTGWVLG